MRTLLVVIFILLFLIPFGIPALLILWLVGKFNPDLKDRISLALVKGVMRGIAFLSGTKVTVIGRENIPEDRPVLYVSNHRGFFDIVVGYPEVKGLCGFVAKKETNKVPLFNIWMRYVHCHFLDRQDPRAGMKTIQDCIEHIGTGKSIWICPEGTRTHGEGVDEFKGGSFRIAEKSGCPVIPVAITHTDDILENHFPWIHAQKVVIEFGAPIETAELDRAAKRVLGQTAHDIVEKMYVAHMAE